MYINKAQIYGNITREIELKQMPNGGMVASFSVATNESYKDKTTGNKVDKVEYHNVVAFGKVAEVIAQYFTKGSPILVEGKLTTRTWQDKDTQKNMYRTEIVLSNFQFGVSLKKDGAQQSASGGYDDSDEYHSPTSQKSIEELANEDINPEDIPF